MRKCRDCQTEIEPDKLLCHSCKEAAHQRSVLKQKVRQREKNRREYQGKTTYKTIEPTREPNKDCPYWLGKRCDLFSPPLCKTKECGFYPPVAERRKAELRRHE